MESKQIGGNKKSTLSRWIIWHEISRTLKSFRLPLNGITASIKELETLGKLSIWAQQFAGKTMDMKQNNSMENIQHCSSSVWMVCCHWPHLHIPKWRSLVPWMPCLEAAGLSSHLGKCQISNGKYLVNSTTTLATIKLVNWWCNFD